MCMGYVSTLGLKTKLCLFQALKLVIQDLRAPIFRFFIIFVGATCLPTYDQKKLEKKDGAAYALKICIVLPLDQ